jgi:hypothetical protein
MREGMAWIVPVPLLSLVTAQHLEQLVCGLPHISIQLLRRVVRYQYSFSFVTISKSPILLFTYYECCEILIP